nr:cuticle protein 7-like [Penaeus vannamei]
MKTAIVALCVVAAAWAAPQGGYNYQAPVVQQPEYPSVPAQYSFQWDVNDQYSGNYYGHQEQRDGDNTQGSYYVQLPDTRLMRVEYYVDEYGFHPVITYEGEAQYPSAPAQVYSQPAPAPTQVYSQPAPAPAPAPVQVYSQPRPCPAPVQVYSQPAPAPTQVYSQPAPAPQPTYQQPAPTPSQLYTQPGK